MDGGYSKNGFLPYFVWNKVKIVVDAVDNERLDIFVKVFAIYLATGSNLEWRICWAPTMGADRILKVAVDIMALRGSSC